MITEEMALVTAIDSVVQGRRHAPDHVVADESPGRRSPGGRRWGRQLPSALAFRTRLIALLPDDGRADLGARSRAAPSLVRNRPAKALRLRA